MNPSGISRSAWFSGGVHGDAAGMRLYAVPQAGGGSATSTALARALGSDLPAHGVRLPFRESRLADPLPDDLHTLADALARALTEHAGEDEPQPSDELGGGPGGGRRTPATTAGTRRFILLGHCSGALLAYETAVRLAGHPGVSAQVAPERFRPHPTAAMSPATFRAYAEEHALVPPEVLATEPLWELLEPTLRADLRLYEAYQPSDHVLDVPLLALHGRLDGRLGPEDAGAWRARTRGPFRLVTLERDHDYLGSRPGDLARALVEALPLFSSTSHAARSLS
jgi:surfactin synthase thioesterase subunit